MSVINKIIGFFIGSKAKRDLEEIAPYVEKIKEVYETLTGLSNDELRERSQSLRNKINEHVKTEKDEISQLILELEDHTISIDDREKLFNRIDELSKTIDNKYKVALDEALPEAFAIIKDTARRFKENDKIVVTATQFDRIWQLPKILLKLRVIKLYTLMSGVQEAIFRNGKWYITTYN